MATVKGAIATAIASGGLSNALLEGFIDGRVKCNLDSYALTTGNLSGDIIKLGQILPAGAKVIALVVYVSAAQTALTASIGDGASATRYGSALTSLQNAGTYFIGGLNYVVGTTTGDNQIQILTGGATATAGTLQIAVLYTKD